jgi:hypothetical protein
VSKPKYIKIDLTELSESVEEKDMPPGNLLDAILEYYYVKPDAILVFGPTSPGEYGWAKIRNRDFLKILTKFCNVVESDPEEKIYDLLNCIKTNKDLKKAIVKEAEKTGKYPLIVELENSWGEAIAFVSKIRAKPEELEYKLKWSI